MGAKLKDCVSFPDRLLAAGGYWQYLHPEFSEYLKAYLRVFEKHRSDIGVVPTAKDWIKLPFKNGHADWKWRRQSLKVLQEQTQGQRFDSVLEIGAWNGWLTKFLARQSQNVIAADYFTNPFDGIGNLSELAQNIEAVQCNLETIADDFKPESFNLIVVNHCLSYMKNPAEYLQTLLILLKPNGKIISLGNTFFKNPALKIKKNEANAATFFKKYNLPLYIGPVKGYMDFEDCRLLQKSGFTIRKYRNMARQHFFASLNRRKPIYVSLIYGQ